MGQVLDKVKKCWDNFVTICLDKIWEQFEQRLEPFGNNLGAFWDHAATTKHEQKRTREVAQIKANLVGNT